MIFIRKLDFKNSGNPKRYHSQDVLRMSGQTSARIKDLSGPVEDIETEGERQLKSLLEKQLNTQATVEQQLAQSRKFCRSTLYKPVTDDVSGIIDLSDYKALEEHDNRITELRLCGLTDEEIRIKLQEDDRHVETKRRKLEQEPTNIQERMDQINRKIENHRKSLSVPDTFAGQTNVGRHSMDLEKSLVKDNMNSKRLSSMLIKNEISANFPHPDDPMNHIPEILEKVAGKKLFEMKRQDKKKKKRSRKNPDEQDKLFTDSDTALHNIETDHTSSLESKLEIIGCRTKEEMMSIQDLGHNITTEGSTGSAIHKTFSNSNEGKIVGQLGSHKSDLNHKVVDGLVKQIPESDIIENRLSVEEIRNLPKFENYDEGTPNNVLYIKNLPNKVTENDLGSLFLRYQCPDKSPITFRIMSGKMRGQAFVTFHDTETATEALHHLNGYKLSDKPIIIHYGKKAS